MSKPAYDHDELGNMKGNNDYNIDPITLEGVHFNEPSTWLEDSTMSPFMTQVLVASNTKDGTTYPLNGANTFRSNSDAMTLTLQGLTNSTSNSFIGDHSFHDDHDRPTWFTNTSSIEARNNEMTIGSPVDFTCNQHASAFESYSPKGKTKMIMGFANQPIQHNDAMAADFTAAFPTSLPNDNDRPSSSTDATAVTTETISACNLSTCLHGIIVHPAAPELGIPMGGVLHAVCSSSSIPWESKLTMIRSILQSNRLSARQPLVIYSIQQQRTRTKLSVQVNTKEPFNTKKIFVPLPFKYPLNAVIYNRSVDETTMTTNHCTLVDQAKRYKTVKGAIIEELVQAESSVLLLNDGPSDRQTTTLHLLLQYMPDCIDIVVAIVFEHPECAALLDFRRNTPLHIALMHAHASPECLDVIKHVYLAYPQAVLVMNRDGVTPIELAYRRSNIPDEIAEFLKGGYKSEKRC